MTVEEVSARTSQPQQVSAKSLAAVALTLPKKFHGCGMTRSNPQRDFAVEIVRTLRANGHCALLAGGCVRDLLLDRPAKDFDVATTARPEQVRDLFGHRKTLAVGASFGVIVVIPQRDSEAAQVEVATFRTDGPYGDGRRPDSVVFCTPEEDAKRRDFTVNGMFYDPIEERVLDFVGGQADLASRVIRAIGDPHQRMKEDKLRMLRSVRFSASLDFVIEAKTADAVREMAAEIGVVSRERIAQELRRMLTCGHRRRAVELCSQLHLLQVILPEIRGKEGGTCPGSLISENDGYERTLVMLSSLNDPSFELAFAVLLHCQPANPVVHDICRRLKLSNAENDRIVWLVSHQNDLNDAPIQSLAQLKRTLSHPYREELISLLRAKSLATAADRHPMLFCAEFLAKTTPSQMDPPPLFNGDDLKRMGLNPSPEFKRLLEVIRDAQLNNEISTPEEARLKIRGLIRNDSAVLPSTRERHVAPPCIDGPVENE